MVNYSLDGDEFAVLVNDEGQYSIWPSSQDVPAGWRIVFPQGTKAEALAFIESEWTDMRPKSLQERMAASAVGRENH